MSTVKELEAELEAIKEENAKLKEAGNHDLSWYNHQIKELKEKNELLEADIHANKNRLIIERQERAVKLKDAEEADRVESLPWQSPFAAFKVLPRGINRDLWGDSGRPVFDSGVDLENFTGVVYLPVVKIIEMGRSIGMLTKEDSDQLIESFKKEKAKNEFAANEGRVLIHGIAELVGRFDSRIADFVVPALDETPGGLGDSEGPVESSGESGEDGGQNGVDHSSEGAIGVSDIAGNSIPDIPEFVKLGRL